MGDVYYQSLSFGLYHLLSLQNCKIPWKDIVRVAATFNQYSSYSHPTFDKIILKGLLVWLSGLCHLNFYLLPLLLYLLTIARQIAYETEITCQQVNKSLFRVCNLLLLAFAVGSVVIIVLVVCSVIGRNCDNNLVEASLGGFVT